MFVDCALCLVDLEMAVFACIRRRLLKSKRVLGISPDLRSGYGGERIKREEGEDMDRGVYERVYDDESIIPQFLFSVTTLLKRGL